MRWTHLILIFLTLPAAFAYPPPYRKSSGYYDDGRGPNPPFIPPSPQEVIWHASPFIPPHAAPVGADSYHVPLQARPRRDSKSAAQGRRNSYSYVPLLPPPQPFPRPPLPPPQPFPRPPPPHDEFGGRPLAHRHDSFHAQAAFPGPPGRGRSRSRSASIDAAHQHLAPGFQPHSSSMLHAHGGPGQHTPFGYVPAPFQPPVHGHAVTVVHLSLVPPATVHTAFHSPHTAHDVNPFLPPGHSGHGHGHTSLTPFVPPPPHVAHGGAPLPAHNAIPPPGYQRNDAAHPNSEAPHPAAGHPHYEKYKNPNYGQPADAHVDAYKRPPHARLDVHVAKAPYEGNPLGLTLPGHWDHPSGNGERGRGEGRRYTADEMRKGAVRH